jgi:hypothetical protein
MPNRALYYPHTTISKPAYLFDSLLYWDSISCIVPSKKYRVSAQYSTNEKIQVEMEEAIERFTHKYVPTDKQKLSAHKIIKATYLNKKPSRRIIGEPITFFAGKLDTLTLDLLLTGGWLKESGPNVVKIEEYLAKRKEGLTQEGPPNCEIKLPLGIGNLLMAALASACSSEHMPPVTLNYGDFIKSINILLAYTDAPQDLQLDTKYESYRTEKKVETFLPKIAESGHFSDLRCLFATIPCLAYDSPYDFPPRMLKNLINARKKDEVKKLQKSFRDVVDNYLIQLRDTDEPDRKIILDEFRQEAISDLNLLEKELKALSIRTLILKEGLVGMAAGTAAGIIPAFSQPISAAIGSILGLSKGLLDYRQQREKILGSHWSSWAISSVSSRFSLW